MKLKLDFEIRPFEKKINPEDRLFFAGSCFSENIATLFERYKFNTITNTHGILYNPYSIAVSMSDCLLAKQYTEKDLFYANETWNSFHHHSRFSHPDKEKCLAGINEQITRAYAHLRSTDHAFITFGSAYAYKYLKTRELVGNCHKIPQQEFEKVLLTKEEIVENYQKLIRSLQNLNKNIHIIFTVSPVRYTRDGVVENNLSKAVLLQAIHELVNTNACCTYFPAYEIVNDELRDYRFFEEDMVHPNNMAINYVWERLVNAGFSEKTKELVNELELILKAVAHRPFNENSEGHAKFKAAHLKKCRDLASRFPLIDFSNEEKYFAS
ncbi:MAG TPA: GSCFA domain-containing protein [Bacteroidia bacterium]